MSKSQITMGDMFWGKSEFYPWWPCVVIKDKRGDFCRNKKKIGIQYYVQFIGPEFDVCWITQGFLIEFKGLIDFETFIEEKQKSSTPNSKQIYSMEMSSEIKLLWKNACEISEDMINKSNEERLAILPKQNNSRTKSKFKSIKRTKDLDSSDLSDSNSHSKIKGDKDIKEDRKINLCNDELNAEEMCLKSFICQESVKYLKLYNSLSQNKVEKIIKSHWDVLDMSHKSLYLNDGQEETIVHQSKVSGRKIKVPSRLRSLPNFKDIIKSDNKKSNSPEKKVTIENVKVLDDKDDLKSDEVIPQSCASPSILSLYKESIDISLLRKIKFNECLTEMMKIIITDIHYLPENACCSCFKIIEPNSKYVKCHGKCRAIYHFHCAVTKKLFRSEDVYQCVHCFRKDSICSICQNSKYMKKQFLTKCQIQSCSVRFHPNCLKILYFIDSSNEEVVFKVCPSHSCLTCFREENDHPCNKIGPFVSCIKCPSTFHSNNVCIPAGSVVLSKERLICQRHNESNSIENKYFFNVCFVCFGENATLKCCRCVAVFHPKCMGMPTYTDLLKDYSCPTCKLEKPLHHGEIIWVNHYKQWYPAEVFSPDHIPRENLIYNSQYNIHVKIVDTQTFIQVNRNEVMTFKVGLSILQNDVKSLNFVVRKAKSMYLCYINWRKRLFPSSFKVKLLGLSELLNVSVKGSSEVIFEINKKRLFQKIRWNCYKEGVKKYVTINQTGKCACALAGKSCYDSYCRNFNNKIECSGNNCSLQNCNNRKFTQSVQIPIIITNVGVISGYGAKITSTIYKGRLIGEVMGQIISAKDVMNTFHSRNCLESVSYVFQLTDSTYINAEIFGNDWRFINHSCKPNSQLIPYDVSGRLRLGIFSLRDITKEEATIDYRNNGVVMKYAFLCHCGNDNCSTIIGPSNLFYNQNQFSIPRCCVNNQFYSELLTKANIRQINENINVKQILKPIEQPSKPSTIKIPTFSLYDPKIEHINVCFLCHKHGELLPCNKVNCDKKFHLQCIDLDEPPSKLWYCPIHFCNTCGIASTIFCSYCPTSHCENHFINQEIHVCSKENLPVNIPEVIDLESPTVVRKIRKLDKNETVDEHKIHLIDSDLTLEMKKVADKIILNKNLNSNGQIEIIDLAKSNDVPDHKLKNISDGPQVIVKKIQNYESENLTNKTKKTDIIGISYNKEANNTYQNLPLSSMTKENIYEVCDLIKRTNINTKMIITRRHSSSSICKIPTKKLKVQITTDKKSHSFENIKKLSNDYECKELSPNIVTKLENLIISPTVLLD